MKLAKLFGRRRSNTEAHEDLQQHQQQQQHQNQHQQQQLHQQQQQLQHLQNQPPPLPPLNANMKSLKYLEHLRSSYRCQQPEEDDEEDNVSLSSACMQRNHPYNNSQRPLLGDRRPQLTVVGGAGGKKGKGGAGLAPSAISAMSALAPLSPPPPQRSYISPYVQQQKRDSARGLHGFNDFDALSQHHLQSPPLQSGYPYGSPPSPTAKSSDFCFDRPGEGLNANAPALQRSIVDVSLSSDCSTAASSPSRYFHQEVPKPTPVPPPVAVHQPAPAHPIVSSGSASPPGYFPKELPQTPLSSLAPPAAPPVAPRVPPKAPSPVYASRFEDDFCMRRPVLNTFHQSPPPPAPAAGHKGKDGPFIFGIDPEEQATDYGLLSDSPSPQMSKSPLVSEVLSRWRRRSVSDRKSFTFWLIEIWGMGAFREWKSVCFQRGVCLFLVVA